MFIGAFGSSLHFSCFFFLVITLSFYSGEFLVHFFFQLTKMIFRSVDSYLQTIVLIFENYILFSDGSFLIAISSYFMIKCVLKSLKKLQFFTFFPYFSHHYFYFSQDQLTSLFVVVLLFHNPGVPQMSWCICGTWWGLL